MKVLSAMSTAQSNDYTDYSEKQSNQMIKTRCAKICMPLPAPCSSTVGYAVTVWAQNLISSSFFQGIKDKTFHKFHGKNITQKHA